MKNTGQPAYRSLYSIVTKNLICKTAAGTALASHGFSHSAVYVWNNLPDNNREAKTCDIFVRKLENSEVIHSHPLIYTFG